MLKEKVKAKNSFASLPRILRIRYYKLIAISLVTLLSGCLFMLIGFGSPVAILIIFGLAGMSALIYALVYRYYLIIYGYKVYEGTVTYKKEVFTLPLSTKPWSAKRPYYYHICTKNNNLYRLDVSKGSEELPMNASVKIYAPYFAHEIPSSGISTLSSIWAFEIIAAPEKKSDPLSQ